jgi:glycine/D-amino acid oxidase-like deaminating enzyme
MGFKLVQDRSDSDNYPKTPLDGSRRADVCIIGAGYTGLSAALHLAQRGYDVALLEARKPGWGASGRNGGQLCSGQRKDQDELTTMVGADSARYFWELAEAAKSLARQLIAEHDIDCDLKPGIAHAMQWLNWWAATATSAAAWIWAQGICTRSTMHLA